MALPLLHGAARAQVDGDEEERLPMRLDLQGQMLGKVFKVGIIAAFKDKASEDDRQPVFDEERDVLLGRGIGPFDKGNLVP